MAARSIASLTLSFGLVSIPVRLYSATESSTEMRFNMLTKNGERVKQQYISEKTRKVVERSEMVKGYEFEKDHFARGPSMVPVDGSGLRNSCRRCAGTPFLKRCATPCACAATAASA